MSYIGVNPNDIELIKYAVYLKYAVGDGKYGVSISSVGYDNINPYANFVHTQKLKNRKTCNVCYNKKKDLNNVIGVIRIMFSEAIPTSNTR